MLDRKVWHLMDSSQCCAKTFRGLIAAITLGFIDEIAGHYGIMDQGECLAMFEVEYWAVCAVYYLLFFSI